MRVKTPPGLICPLEGKHREYITDDKQGVEVPDTPFYRRLLDEGSLLPAEQPAVKPAKEASANE